MRTWTDTGLQLHDRERAGREGHNWTTRDEIERRIDLLEWHPVTPGVTIRLPHSPGVAIESCIDELGLRRVVAGHVRFEATQGMAE